MRKKVLLTGLVLILTFFTGCGGKGESNETSAPETTKQPETTVLTTAATTAAAAPGSIEDYYPIIENARYLYEGEGNEYASYSVHIDYASKNRVQQRVDSGGTVLARVVEVKDGKATRVFSREEVYYRANLLESSSGIPEILLTEPIQKGTSWTLSDGRVRTITDISAGVSTPSGSYSAVAVETQGPNDKTVDYYAKGVGLVKSVFISGQTEISSSLEKLEKDAALIQQVCFYYPNLNDGKYHYRLTDVSFKTNDVTRKILEKAYKAGVKEPLGEVLSQNTEIKSLYLNQDGMVYIDLSREFLTEMNAGAGYESMILQSVANTFGTYFQAERVILTVDNALYESGHIALKKGEYITIDVENAVEAK